MARLLVAEDDTHIQDLLRQLFRSSGFEVASAADGQEAIDWLQEDGFDALVLDLMMPRVNGLQVIEFLQQQMPQMMRKTVVATAYAELAEPTTLEQVCAVVRKPFDVERLVSAVQKCATQ